MAGLQQYYFFPTDFFYPRSPSAASDAASRATVVPVQALNDDYANPFRASDHGSQAVSPAADPRVASLSASVTKKELDSRTPIIAEPKKSSNRYPDKG